MRKSAPDALLQLSCDFATLAGQATRTMVYEILDSRMQYLHPSYLETARNMALNMEMAINNGITLTTNGVAMMVFM